MKRTETTQIILNFKRKISQRLSPKSLSKFDFSSNPFRSCSSIASKRNDYNNDDDDDCGDADDDDYFNNDDAYDDYKGLDLYNDCDDNIDCSKLS